MTTWLVMATAAAIGTLAAHLLLTALKGGRDWWVDRIFDHKLRELMGDRAELPSHRTETETVKRASRRVLRQIRGNVRGDAEDGDGLTDDKPETEDEEVRRAREDPQSWYV